MLRPRQRRRRSTRTKKEMTLGDVLFRIAVIAPEQYKALDILARAIYAREWPIDDDALLLMESLPAAPQ